MGEIMQTSSSWFGHPRGLSTLFFTELWERMSYYGMRALLVLFMTEQIARGGLGMSVGKATAIYGLYTFGVYALALPGGWMADKLLGQRKAVLVGGILIACGHYTLAIPALFAFYLGLGLIVLGTGLLKPNVSAIVGELYPEGGARRDAGFSIFYMGINIGAIIGPFACSTLGEKVNWHLGFSAAGIGMTLGLIQYVIGQKHLQGIGDVKDEAAAPEALKRSWKYFFFGVAATVFLTFVVAALSMAEILPLTLVGFVRATGVLLVILAILYFAWIILFVCQNRDEQKRVAAIATLFFGAAMFWSGFEQAGSSMNLFARDFTNRVFMGWEVPVGYFQNINPLFIVILAPVAGSLWVRLGKRNPSIPAKFGYGLFLLAVGFFVLAWGSMHASAENQVGPMWLIVTYFFHTVGELCLSPVGLSSITKLSPKRMVGQMMGTWFLGAALGNLIAGLVAGYLETLPTNQLFFVVASIAAGTGFLFLLFSAPIRKMTGGVT